MSIMDEVPNPLVVALTQRLLKRRFETLDRARRLEIARRLWGAPPTSDERQSDAATARSDEDKDETLQIYRLAEEGRSLTPSEEAALLAACRKLFDKASKDLDTEDRRALG